MTILSRSPGRRPLATSWPASNAVACELSTHDTGASGVGCSAAGLCRNAGIAPGLTATLMVNAMRLGPLDEAAQPARRMNNPVLKHGTDGRRIACGSASLWTQTQHQDHDALQHHDQDFERVGVGRAGHVDTACAVMELVHESPQSVQVVVAATHPVVDEGGCKYAQQGAPEGSQPPTRKRRVRAVRSRGRAARNVNPSRDPPRTYGNVRAGLHHSTASMAKEVRRIHSAMGSSTCMASVLRALSARVSALDAEKLRLHTHPVGRRWRKSSQTPLQDIAVPYRAHSR